MQPDQTFFSPKSSTRIGCWNVRTLGKPTRQNGKLRDVLRTMEEKRIEVLALSEVRWPGHGILQLNGTTTMYSGMPEHEVQNCRKGVAVVLSANAPVAWRAAKAEFHPVSERLLRTRLKMHSGFVSVVAVYAPTNEEGNEEEAEKFYAELQEVVCDVPKKICFWSGVDEITAEMLKLGGEPVVHWLTCLSCRVWHSEKVPDDWLKQIVVPLHKKGAYDVCDNFRG